MLYCLRFLLKTDLPMLEILTEGFGMPNAIEMARDAIGLKVITMEDQKEKIPNPRMIKEIDALQGTFAQEGESWVSMVDVDFAEYRRRMDNKTVRRNVTLPNWLNQEAEKAHINVSGVLQEALMLNLGVHR